MFHHSTLITAVLSTGLLTSAAFGGSVSGTVIGQWSNPALTGNLILATGQFQFFDNTTTAYYNIVNSPDGSAGSALIYGASGTSPQPFSVLTFFGSTLTGVPSNTPVLLGKLTFLNGTSDLNSLIFGAVLTLTVKNDPSVDPLEAVASITTTQNTGFDSNFDADFFSFNVLFPTTFNVYEGSNATVDIYGQFIGDPQIELTSLQLEPGETGGFIGNGLPTPTPEPGTLATSLASLAALAIYARKRRRNQTVGEPRQ
ncbi:MAG: choice-of-anchor K domain-containing protein [Acidobacteriota bacterium]